MCDTSKRLGFIGILVEDMNSVEKVNEALSAWTARTMKSRP